jgi:hypothetical protein
MQHVIFDWNGKQISRKIEDLIDRSNTTKPDRGQSAAVQSAGYSMAVPPQYFGQPRN